MRKHYVQIKFINIPLGTDVLQIPWFFMKKMTFNTFVYKEKKKYLVIGSSSTLTSEYQILDAKIRMVSLSFPKRTRGLEYSIPHYGDSFTLLHE